MGGGQTWWVVVLSGKRVPPMASTVDSDKTPDHGVMGPGLVQSLQQSADKRWISGWDSSSQTGAEASFCSELRPYARRSPPHLSSRLNLQWPASRLRLLLSLSAVREERLSNLGFPFSLPAGLSMFSLAVGSGRSSDSGGPADLGPRREDTDGTPLRSEERS